MSYNAALTSTRDRIRFITGDIDETAEVFPDSTYDAEIAMYTNWKWAAADMADSMAVALDKRVNGVTLTGDVAAQWTDRAKTLRARAVALRKEAQSEDDLGGAASYGKVVTISQDFLTGGEW